MRDGAWPEDRLKKPHKQMRSVWAITAPSPDEKRFGKHPTQKPLDLLRRVVLASTNEGDVVLDPFTGSSTTGLAAFMYGRGFIGIDTEKEYLDLSIKEVRGPEEKQEMEERDGQGQEREADDPIVKLDSYQKYLII